MQVASYRNQLTSPEQMIAKQQAKRDSFDPTQSAIQGVKIGLGIGAAAGTITALNGGGEDRLAKLLHDGTGHAMVWHTDANGLLVAVQDLGHLRARFEDEGKWAWKGLLHHLKHRLVDHPGVLGDVAQVGANEGEVMLSGIDALDLADAFDGALVGDIAAHAIDGVGGIDDDASVSEHVHHLLHAARVGVFFVKPDEFSHAFERSLDLQA